MTGRREEILRVLGEQGRALDDDEIANLIKANRHYVNAVCRALAHEGAIEREKDPQLTKIVNRLAATRGEHAAAPTTLPSATVHRSKRGSSTADRARRNVEELIGSFEACLSHFENSNAFPGPSLYFHEQAIARRRMHRSVELAVLPGDVRDT